MRWDDAPVREAGDAVAQVAARLILGVDEGLDVDLGQLPGEALLEVARELVLIAKGRLAALEGVLAALRTGVGVGAVILCWEVREAYLEAVDKN